MEGDDTLERYMASTPFVTPPGTEDNLIVASYALEEYLGWILVRKHDRANGHTHYEVYWYPDPDDDDALSYAPDKYPPELGAFIGVCQSPIMADGTK